MAETLTPKTLAANPERYHLIDVRDAEDYAAGHVEGAVHIPLAELEARLGEIPDDRVPVTICRVGGGRSAAAAELLSRSGHPDGLALEGGTLGWQAAQTATSEGAKE